MSKPLERQVIEQARALIADPAAWTQGEFARDLSGNAVSWRSREAVQFCLWGALNRETDTLYLYSEHYRGEAEPSVHAAAIRARSRRAKTRAITIAPGS